MHMGYVQQIAKNMKTRQDAQTNSKAKSGCIKIKCYMLIWTLSVKRTVPLVVAADLSERNYPGKCSRDI